MVHAVQDLASLQTVYPGNEIPEWFSHQTDDGNSIHIQLPPNWFHINDARFQFVFCTVLVLNRSEPLDDIQFEFNFKTNNNSDDHRYYYNDERISLIIWSDTINTDHVYIRYQTINLEDVFGAMWSSICSNFNEASFSVCFKGKSVINWEIKKCGLELVNTWDRGESKRPFDEYCSGQPDGFQDKDHDDHSHNPRINSKRINLMDI